MCFKTLSNTWTQVSLLRAVLVLIVLILHITAFDIIDNRIFLLSFAYHCREET